MQDQKAPSDIVCDEIGTPNSKKWTGKIDGLGSDLVAVQHHHAEGRFRFSVQGDQVVISGLDRVGIIVLPSGRRVVIRSKLSGIRILQWLTYLDEFPDLQSWSSMGCISEGDSWQTLIARLFLAEVDRVTRFHLRKGYVKISQIKSWVTGKVDWQKASNKPWQLPKLEQVVRVRKLETPANQMLASALQRVVLFQKDLDGFGRDELSRLRREWATICGPAPDRQAVIQASLIAPPDGYRYALQLAGLILRGASIDSESGAGGEVFTLSLSRLWESSLKRMCMDLSTSTGWAVSHGSAGIRTWDDAKGTDDQYRCMRTDTLLSQGMNRWVLDAKYKRDYGNEGRNDRFQMCAYAIGFRANRATLVYPSCESKSDIYRRLLCEEIGTAKLLIDSIALPMEKGPEECRKVLLSLLLQSKS